jgi:hypothetical protein
MKARITAVLVSEALVDTDPVAAAIDDRPIFGARLWMLALAGVVGLACGTAGDGNPPDTTTTYPPPLTTTAEPTGSGGSSQADAGDTTAVATTAGDGPDPDTGPIFDVGSPDGGAKEMGCRNIDFLFVIDNSNSMEPQQQNLLDSFPGFISAIQDTLVAVDSYHVGVMTSDAYEANEFGCNQLGALVTQTVTGPCGPFAEGHRFLTEQDDLATAFQCIAQVGTDGSFLERPVSALVAGVQPPLFGPGGCNEGFIRDDAILVVVIITEDPPYPDTPDDAHPLLPDIGVWHDPVLAAKLDNPEAVVVIGVVPWGDLTCVCPWCCPGGIGCMEPSPNLIDFVESFGTQGALASVCEPDYAPIFAATIDTIEATCAGFDPPG